MNKAELRKKYLRIRSEIAPDCRKKADSAICERLKDIDEVANADFIASYVSDGTEPDLKELELDLMREGKKFCFPRFVKGSLNAEYEMAEAKDMEKDMAPGAYGILEPGPNMPAVPESMRERITWLVPGVVFDKECRRVGRGKAVYDRLLKRGSRITIGIFYECQQYASAPMEEHDYPLDMIVTEKGIYRRR